MENKERVVFNMDSNLKRQVKQLALDKNTSATQLYVQWIKEGLKKENR